MTIQKFITAITCFEYWPCNKTCSQNTCIIYLWKYLWLSTTRHRYWHWNWQTLSNSNATMKWSIKSILNKQTDWTTWNSTDYISRKSPIGRVWLNFLFEQYKFHDFELHRPSLRSVQTPLPRYARFPPDPSRSHRLLVYQWLQSGKVVNADNFANQLLSSYLSLDDCISGEHWQPFDPSGSLTLSVLACQALLSSLSPSVPHSHSFPLPGPLSAWLV